MKVTPITSISLVYLKYVSSIGQAVKLITSQRRKFDVLAEIKIVNGRYFLNCYNINLKKLLSDVFPVLFLHIRPEIHNSIPLRHFLPKKNSPICLLQF